MMISVYYKKKTSLNGYLCDMDTARKHGRTFSALCDLQYPYSFCNISNYYSNGLIWKPSLLDVQSKIEAASALVYRQSLPQCHIASYFL